MDKSFRFNSHCIKCIIGKYIDKLPEGTCEEDRLKFARGVLDILRSCPDDISSPEIVALIVDYRTSLFGFYDEYADVKSYFNKLLSDREGYFEEHICSAEDSVLEAMKYALLGNYIDFGALNSVEDEKLLAIPKEAKELNIGESEYQFFINDLKNARRLVYLTDNCGEIVFDKLFIKALKKAFPTLEVTAIVRGGAVLNDATLTDAESVGLDSVAEVTDNGNCIAGTVLKKLSPSAKEKIDGADVIISKGQANFETLCGSGLNIYYLFLCKCTLYSEKFNVPQFTGMFKNDKRM